MSYLICLHPTEEAHQSWSMCWSRQWPWSWWPSPGGLRHSETVRPHSLTNHSDTVSALQLEKWTKTKLQAWYTLSVHLLDITLTLYFCLFLWHVWYVFYVAGSVFKHSQCYLIIIQLSSPICQLSLRSWQLLPMPWPRKGHAVIVFGHTTVVTGDPFQVCHIWPRPLAGPAAMEVVVGSNPKTSGQSHAGNPWKPPN